MSSDSKKTKVSKSSRNVLSALFATALIATSLSPFVKSPASAQQNNAAKPNILVIFGDDVGQSNLSAYSRGLMGYKTPNIDRIANEGMMFTDYYAENSCTAGRSTFTAVRELQHRPDGRYANEVPRQDGAEVAQQDIHPAAKCGRVSLSSTAMAVPA